MNILLIGGSGGLINNLIIKLNKEGHRLYLLTGDRYQQAPYQKVFERYHFTYDSTCLNEIFESIHPDVTIFMGAYDTNFQWQDEEKEAVRYLGCLNNILMAYAMNSGGRFIYLSSREVYSGDYQENITENEPLSPSGLRGMALAQAEELCESYRTYQNRDIITLRLDHLYSIPKERREVNNICARMCLEVLEDRSITVHGGNSFSLLYETDAVEYMYRLIGCNSHKYSVYNLSSSIEISQWELAELVKSAMEDEGIEILEREENWSRRVLSNQLLESEFGTPFCCEERFIIYKMAAYMKKNRYAFVVDTREQMPFWKRVAEKSGWFMKAVIPFLENLLCFLPFFWLNNRTADNATFGSLDFYLLYVLIFAIVYGQQQATFSAVLSVAGYCFRQMYDRTGFEVMLDANTYVWIAQLFILGLVVGYMRDQLTAIKRENEDEKEYLADQLNDIQDINSSNVRVKDALTTQIVNQNDSVGKIYSITSALDQYSPEEVLF